MREEEQALELLRNRDGGYRGRVPNCSGSMVKVVTMEEKIELKVGLVYGYGSRACEVRSASFLPIIILFKNFGREGTRVRVRECEVHVAIA